MRALRPFLLLGLVVFCGAALTTLPARLFVSLLPSPVTLEAVDGTVWSGHAGQVTLDQVPLGALDWSWSPWPLLWGRVAVDVQLQRPDGRLQGHLEQRLGGRIDVRDVSLDLPLDALHPAATGVSWSGRIAGSVRHAQLAALWPVALDASFRLEHVRGPQVAAELGSYRLDFRPSDARGDTLIGHLSDGGGPLAVDGVLQLSPTRAYDLTGSVAVRASAPADWNGMLAFLGSADATGRRPFSLAGTF